MIHPGNAAAMVEQHRREMMAEARAARHARAIRAINMQRSECRSSLASSGPARWARLAKRISASPALPSGTGR